MRNKKGFTLTNALVVAAIIGLFAALLLPAIVCKKGKDEKPSVPDMRYSILSPDERVFSGAVAAHAVGDVNGDGLADIITADAKALNLYLKDETGKFQNPVLIAALQNVIAGGGYTGDLRLSISLSDIDNDDDLDLTVGDTKGIAIFYNDGKGNFSQ